VTRRVARPVRADEPPSSPLAGVDPGRLIAPVASIIGLAVVAALTLGLFTGNLPFVTKGPGPGNNGQQPGNLNPDTTPAPSNVVVVPPEVAPQVPGTIVFAKQGNIWVQSGAQATQITDTGQDSMPSWSPDGLWIYFIQTVSARGLFPSEGAARYYTLTYPILTRVHPDGTSRQKLLSGLYKGSGAYQWFYWLRQPVASSDGHTIALFSDGPDPTQSDVVLQFFDTKTGKLTRVPVSEDPPLGHQDGTWRADGKQLLYVRNGRDGSRGAPAIFTYDPVTKKSVALTGPGYTSPAFSPDGKWIAATKTTNFGTDVVILNAKTGAEVLRVTSDGHSWAPVWSPAGDSVAYLHITFQIVDLRLTPLVGRAGSWTLGDQVDVTEYSGLDGASRPGWFIPADQSPAPTPGSTTASTAPGRSGSGAGAASGGAASP
jgi:Tol biopolymer transport system component